MKRNPPDFGAMHAFVEIVHNGSLSAAERALGIPKATLSRKLAELERTLGTPLLRRTTRAQSLTPAGQALYDRVAPLLAEAERAAADIHVSAKEPAGLVRVAAAVGFGKAVLMPILARFVAEVPKVRIDLDLSEDPVRLVDAGFDLAIRMGNLEASDLVSRRVARIEQCIVASPAYVEAHGSPTSIAELAAHTTVVRDPRHATWAFEGDDGPREVAVRWRMSTGAMTSLVDGARLGIGIAMIPRYLAAPSLATGELVALDVGATPVTNYATALFPRAPTPSAAVRALLDRIVAELADDPLLSPPKTKRRARKRS